jgi:hypothetical protein
VPGWVTACGFPVLLGWVAAALAGPPFVTDDPEPTELGHFEMYLYF